MDFMKVFDQTVRDMYVFPFRSILVSPIDSISLSLLIFFIFLGAFLFCSKREVNLKVLKVPEIEQKVWDQIIWFGLVVFSDLVFCFYDFLCFCGVLGS